MGGGMYVGKSIHRYRDLHYTCGASDPRFFFFSKLSEKRSGFFFFGGGPLLRAGATRRTGHIDKIFKPL